MLRDDALLLIGHGSASRPGAGRIAHRHAEALRARGIFAEVAVGFLNGAPSAGDALAGLTARVVHIVPLFMEAGYFTTVAVPRALGLEAVPPAPHPADLILAPGHPSSSTSGHASSLFLGHASSSSSGHASSSSSGHAPSSSSGLTGGSVAAQSFEKALVPRIDRAAGDPRVTHEDDDVGGPPVDMDGPPVNVGGPPVKTRTAEMS